jgi:Metal-sensitive transcriptional repressor
MNECPIHQCHPDIVKRLRRVEGHLRSIIDMIEKPCLMIGLGLTSVGGAGRGFRPPSIGSRHLTRSPVRPRLPLPLESTAD